MARYLRESGNRKGQAEHDDALVNFARREGPEMLLAESLYRQQEAVSFAGHPVESRAILEEGREIFAREGNREGMYRMMAVLGQRLEVTSKVSAGIHVLEETMRGLAGTPFEEVERTAADELGAAYGRGHDLELSRQMLSHALALAWKSRQKDQTRQILLRLGITFRDMGRLTEARNRLQEAMLQGNERMARAHTALGETELLAGDAQAAIEQGERADREAMEASIEDVRTDALTILARAHMLSGDFSLVDANFRQASEFGRAKARPGNLGFAEIQWGEALLIEKKPQASIPHLREAVKTFTDIERPAFAQQAQALLSIALSESGQLREARKTYEETANAAKDTQFIMTRNLVNAARGHITEAEGRARDAAEAYSAARRAADEHGVRWDAALYRYPR